MKGWQHLLVCLLLVAGLLTTPRLAQADGSSDDYMPGQVVVRLSEGASVAGVGKRYGARVVEQSAGSGIYLLELSSGSSVGQVVRQMQGDSDVRQVEPNYKLWSAEAQGFSLGFSGRYALANPDGSPSLDQNYAGQWAAVKIGLSAAQTRSRGQGVTVALLDTGAEATHPALAGKLVAGWDFVDNDANPAEASTGQAAGHGTFLSGLVALVAPEARILPVRVLDGEGAGTLFAVAQGIRYAADNGAKVINLSLGADRDSKTLQAAVDYAASRGALVVASVGNRSAGSRSGTVMYPARYRSAVAVAATDSDDVKASFSNWGKETDLSAPGVAIYSAYLGGSYAWWSGTSASAALVSGGAALVWAQQPGLQSDQVRGRLQSTAVDIDSLNYREYRGKLGDGRIDLDAATR